MITSEGWVCVNKLQLKNRITAAGYQNYQQQKSLIR